MSNNQVPQPAATKEQEDEFPVAAIICIAIGAYVVVIAIILLIRQILLKRGICSEGCSVCGKEAQLSCCECCIGCGEACNCCANRSIESCLDSICPARRQLDCADIIMCKCCTDQTSECCNSEEPLCDYPECPVPPCSCPSIKCHPRDGMCQCGACDCKCQPPAECDQINCICCTINCGDRPVTDDDYGYEYPAYPPPQQTGGYPPITHHPGTSYPTYHHGPSMQRPQQTYPVP